MSGAYRSLLLLLPVALGACQGPPVEVRARVLAPDHHSPEGTVQTYLAALACNEAREEYRCLGESLKERYGATLDLYLLARPQLLDEIGPLRRYAYKLQFAREERRPDGLLHWYEAAGAERVGFLMQAQAYYDVYLADGRKRGGMLELAPKDYVEVDRSSLDLKLRGLALGRDIGAAEVVRVDVGLEWKIADFLLPEEQQSPRP